MSKESRKEAMKSWIRYGLTTRGRSRKLSEKEIEEAVNDILYHLSHPSIWRNVVRPYLKELEERDKKVRDRYRQRCRKRGR